MIAGVCEGLTVGDAERRYGEERHHYLVVVGPKESISCKVCNQGVDQWDLPTHSGTTGQQHSQQSRSSTHLANL